MCGIFGQINKNNKVQFNKSCFITLGIANDTRGGDSCGIFIDGNVEYGIDKTKLFSKFFNHSELLKNTNTCNIALGHCRKASVGAKTIAEAQPCVIKNGDKVEYVVIHNGTVYNYKELAAKYIPNVDIKNMTDSQVLTYIFYHTGFDVLSEYIGGAAFVAVDYRGDKPKTYFWKGSSKQTTYSKEETEERPLYLYQNEDSLYFSSLYDWLQPFSNFEEVLTFTANHLITLTDDFKLAIVKEYNRNNCTQSISTVVSKQTDYNPYYGDYYDDYYSYNGYNSYNYYNRHSYSNVNQYWKDIQAKKKDDKIKMDNIGLFTKNGEYLNGLHYMALDGSESRSETIYPCYFVEGYLLKNKECYDFLTKFTQGNELTMKDLPACIPETLEYLSMFPSIIGKFSDDPYIYCYVDAFQTKEFTGKIQIFGSKDVYIVDGGTIDTKYEANNYDILYKIYNEAATFKVDTPSVYKRIYEECENLI